MAAKSYSEYVNEVEKTHLRESYSTLNDIASRLKSNHGLDCTDDALLEAYKIAIEEYDDQELKSKSIQEQVKLNALDILLESSNIYPIDQFFTELNAKAAGDGYDDADVINAYNEALQEKGIDPELEHMYISDMRDVETTFWELLKQMSDANAGGIDNASDENFQELDLGIGEEPEILGTEGDTVEVPREEAPIEDALELSDPELDEEVNNMEFSDEGPITESYDYDSVRQATKDAFSMLIPAEAADTVLDDVIVPLAAEMSKQEFTSELIGRYPGSDKCKIENLFDLIQPGTIGEPEVEAVVISGAPVDAKEAVEELEAVTNAVEDNAGTEETTEEPVVVKKIKMTNNIAESYDIFKNIWKSNH